MQNDVAYAIRMHTSSNIRLLLQALFTDNTYGVDSGGDPKVIPSLTWENFSGFHKKFYHPTNSRIYFYGDDGKDGLHFVFNRHLLVW